MSTFSIDAGARARVSQITTLLDGKLLGSDDFDLFQNVGTGNVLWGENKKNMSVTSGQYSIIQSKRFCPYFSGKTQLIECTFDNFQTEINTVKRIGYFSSNSVAPYNSNLDGFFIEDNGTIKSLKAYRNGVLTIDVPFTSMQNYRSIKNYDWEKFSVVAFDFLWLGGAVLRFFVKTRSGFQLIHAVNYSGSAKDVFILSPNQPIRYEIRSSTGLGSLRYVCSQVGTEGSINEAGKTLSLYNPTSITTNSTSAIYALKSIKKQAAFRDVAVQILSISVSNTATTDAGILMLIVNPTLSAPLSYVNKFKIQEGTATTQMVIEDTGRVVCAVPINVSGSTDIIRENFLSFLSSNIDNSMDEYILAYKPTTNNQTVNGVLTIKEY